MALQSQWPQETETFRSCGPASRPARAPAPAPVSPDCFWGTPPETLGPFASPLRGAGDPPRVWAHQASAYRSCAPAPTVALGAGGGGQGNVGCVGGGASALNCSRDDCAWLCLGFREPVLAPGQSCRASRAAWGRSRVWPQSTAGFLTRLDRGQHQAPERFLLRGAFPVSSGPSRADSQARLGSSSKSTTEPCGLGWSSPVLQPS